MSYGFPPNESMTGRAQNAPVVSSAFQKYYYDQSRHREDLLKSEWQRLNTHAILTRNMHQNTRNDKKSIFLDILIYLHVKVTLVELTYSLIFSAIFSYMKMQTLAPKKVAIKTSFVNFDIVCKAFTKNRFNIPLRTFCQRRSQGFFFRNCPSQSF